MDKIYGFGGNFSIAVDFKLTGNLPSSHPAIIWFWGKNNTNVESRFILDIDRANSTLRINVTDRAQPGTSRMILYANNVLNTGEWYSVVISNTTVGVNLYINGVLITPSSGDGNPGFFYTDFGNSITFPYGDDSASAYPNYWPLQ